MTDPAFLTVPELGRLLRLRRVSAVELASDCLERLERFGPAPNADVGVPREPALAEQLTGRTPREAVLLEIGMQYQARTDFHRQRPPGL